jgi:hypothetical protein
MGLALIQKIGARFFFALTANFSCKNADYFPYTRLQTFTINYKRLYMFNNGFEFLFISIVASWNRSPSLLFGTTIDSSLQ